MSWLSDFTGIHIPIAKPLAVVAAAGATAIAGPAAGAAVLTAGNALASSGSGAAVPVPVTSATPLAFATQAAPNVGAPAVNGSGLPSWALPAAIVAAVALALWLALRK